MSSHAEPKYKQVYEFGSKVAFGKTSDDYAIHRAGFPDQFFELLRQRNWIRSGQTALDVGSGTGTVARGLASLGCQVTGVDPSAELLTQARQMSSGVSYEEGTAESLPAQSGSFDVITAGQCWHWFRRPEAAREFQRVLKSGGRVIIAHFDWLPLSGNLVSATEDLILRYNPDWAASRGTGMYPAWLTDLAEAGFKDIETTSFDIAQPYSPEAWRSRIRASAGVAASLSSERVAEFDADLADILKTDFPDQTLLIPHRVWMVTARKN